MDLHMYYSYIDRYTMDIYIYIYIYICIYDAMYLFSGCIVGKTKHMI